MSRPKVITDMRQYQRDYHVRRRAVAITNGICIECNDDDAAPDRTKCQDCLTINANAQRERRAA